MPITVFKAWYDGGFACVSFSFYRFSAIFKLQKTVYDRRKKTCNMVFDVYFVLLLFLCLFVLKMGNMVTSFLDICIFSKVSQNVILSHLKLEIVLSQELQPLKY